jgi:hypothetical protein
MGKYKLEDAFDNYALHEPQFDSWIFIDADDFEAALSQHP